MGNSVWVEDSERFLVEAFLRHVDNGDRGENGFKKSVWLSVVGELNAAYQHVSTKPFTVAQAKSKEVIVSFYPFLLTLLDILL